MKKLILAIAVMASLQLKADVSDWHLETVIGYVVDQNGIFFQVYDGGCTQPEDFYVQVEKNSIGESNVTLYRKKPDLCKAFLPYGQMMRFTYDAIGIKKNEVFKINNPINPGFIRY